MNKVVQSRAKKLHTKIDLIIEFPMLKFEDIYILGITGSRLKGVDKNHINKSRKFFEDTLNSILSKKVGKRIVIIEGGAKEGIDVMAKVFGSKSPKVFMVIERLPKFERDGTPYNVLDYHTRNSEVVDVSDSVLAFWDGISSGTSFTVEKARKNGNLEAVFRLD